MLICEGFKRCLFEFATFTSAYTGGDTEKIILGIALEKIMETVEQLSVNSTLEFYQIMSQSFRKIKVTLNNAVLGHIRLESASHRCVSG